MTTAELQKKARQLRADEIKMITEAGSGHPGGSLSVTDILVSLYYSKMDTKVGAKTGEHDVCVLSKGHAAPALYAVLADKGYFPKEDLWTLRKLGSHLQGHPDSAKLPGVDCSTGSLGQGVSVATGIARGFKIMNNSHKVYCVTGDGELQEGLCWEAFMAAAHLGLDNLTVIVDRNTLQIDGRTEDVMGLKDIEAKFAAFGFGVDVVDGHDFDQLLAALDKEYEGKPHCIIAKTVKGKGVSFMEDQVGWHGNAPSKEQCEQALAELEG